MMTFRNHRLRDLTVPMGTNWLLNDIAEAKGKQGLYTHQVRLGRGYSRSAGRIQLEQ
ncbi:MAG: hypothetical protein U5J62_02830 [Desulfurivibrio sp.]|nr:hypothetical protein [Desulfurivibrio sp.]